MGKGLDPAGLVTHIGGLNSVIEATKHLPDIAGGKKLIYTHIQMPLTPISEFDKLGESSDVYKQLANICKNNNGLWSVAAESFLLSHAELL